MQITKQDTEMFRNLSSSSTGKQLLSYLERLLTDVCDSRNWKEVDTKESTQKVANIIQKGLVDKIKLQNEKKEVTGSEFE